MHSLWAVQPTAQIYGISCRTFQWHRIFAQFSRVETDKNQINNWCIIINKCSPSIWCRNIGTRHRINTYSVMRVSRLPSHKRRSSNVFGIAYKYFNNRYCFSLCLWRKYSYCVEWTAIKLNGYLVFLFTHCCGLWRYRSIESSFSSGFYFLSK